MAYIVDIDSDLDYVDGIATVTLHPRNPQSSDIPNVDAVRDVLTRRELSIVSDIADPSQAVAFEIQGTNEPYQGWHVTEADGTKWTVLSVDKLPLSAGHRLVCVKQK
jgi:hypothetical protein